MGRTVDDDREIEDRAAEGPQSESEKMADNDCEIILFPIRKRVGRIRHAAAKFVDGRSKAQQASYWKLISGSLAESMNSQGFDRAEIEQAISEMRDSVQEEINRMTESQGKSTESK